MTATAPTAPARSHTRWTIDDVFDRPGSVRALALLRIALGPIVLLHLEPFLRATAAGRTYDQTFHEPWWGWMPELPGPAQTVFVWAAAVGAVAFTVGWRTRLAGAVTTLGVAGNLFLAQHHFHHNRAFLLILLTFVTIGDAGRVLSLDARARRARGAALDDRTTVWPLFTLRALVSSVYLASGGSKLIDADWVSGLVLWDRTVRYQDLVRDAVPGALSDPVVELVTARWFHAITSPAAVATELFVGVGLWFARTRLAAVWLALVFHLAIEVTASVQIFSLAGIAALVIWATPATRDRVVILGPGRLPWLERLDVLGRFEVRRVAADEAPAGGIEVVDRDGAVLSGADARRLVWSRLPPTFPFVAPWRRWR